MSTYNNQYYYMVASEAENIPLFKINTDTLSANQKLKSKAKNE